MTLLSSLQIIQVNLTSEQPKALAAGETLEFTYAVKWVPTATPFSRRFERYLDYNFFEHQVPPASRQSRCEPPQQSVEGPLMRQQSWLLSQQIVSARSTHGQRLMCVLLCVRVQIHWFSIFNSFMMVLFLTGLVAMILLRTLKRDYAR